MQEDAGGGLGGLLEGVGRTPLLRLRRLSEELGYAVERYGFKQGDCVVECSSGNIAISVAFVAARLGLRAVIAAPEETSHAKLGLMKLLGAEVILGCSWVTR